MEIEKRLSFAVGYAFQRTYLEEDRFTKQLEILLRLLAKKQKKFQTFSICDASNMFLGTAYRAAKISKFIFDEAQIRVDNPHLYEKLMLVHHDLIDGVIHPLYALMNYLKLNPVLNLLGTDASSIKQCFTEAFGKNFEAARHALAHEDDRMVRADLIDQTIISRLSRIQHRATTGSGFSGLHERFLDGSTFAIDFSEENFLKLLALISKLIDK